MNILQLINYFLSALFIAIGVNAIYTYAFYDNDPMLLIAGIALIALQVWKYISDEYIITIDWDDEDEL